MSFTGTNRDEALERIADHIGELIHFWGFSPHCGRIWTLLFLNPDPMTADQISQRLGISAGLTSQALNELKRWGVVHRIRRSGGPGFLWEEETNVWRCITHVLEEREMGLLDQTEVELQNAITAIKKSNKDSLRSHMVSRLELLLYLTKGVKGFLKAMLMAKRIDGSRLQKLLQTPIGGRQWLTNR